MGVWMDRQIGRYVEEIDRHILSFWHCVYPRLVYTCCSWSVQQSRQHKQSGSVQCARSCQQVALCSSCQAPSPAACHAKVKAVPLCPTQHAGQVALSGRTCVDLVGVEVHGVIFSVGRSVTFHFVLVPLFATFCSEKKIVGFAVWVSWFSAQLPCQISELVTK